ncbi:MAG: hypothetical protein A2W20_03345 [Candidatus Aminicenantes bacterium RBG_16_66_30]|nr:MAG: hypothetical protein A2W20_03345 [Candidatus Aminicenantes bacterium RBG_16_66_30]
MPRLILVLAIIGAVLPASDGSLRAAQAPGGSRLRDVLPAEGLIASSVARIRDQTALDAYYYLADERVLGLDGKADAVFARYRAGGGEALVLVVSYPTEAVAAEVYGRFGRDFFPGGIDPKSVRVVKELESGDFAGSARARSILVVVLEAPDRRSCEELLRRLEERALALL